MRDTLVLPFSRQRIPDAGKARGVPRECPEPGPAVFPDQDTGAAEPADSLGHNA